MPQPRRVNSPRNRETSRQHIAPTDNHHSDTSKLRAPTQWNGAQLHRASWFNAKIKEAKNTYRFIQLVMYSTIPIPKSGATAVYNDEHACDHHFEQNVGSWAAPCKRRRTTVTAASAAAVSTIPGSMRPHEQGKIREKSVA